MLKNNILIRKAGKINWSNSKPRRAGIILYDDFGIYLGVDKISKELTDFGGEINYINEDTITGSLREYNEETLGTFPDLTWFTIFSSDAILSDSIVIFLVKITENLEPLIQKFRSKKNEHKGIELIDILHISYEKIRDFPIFERIKPLLLFAVENYNWI